MSESSAESAVTIRDVARHAGVSIATVSHVVNDTRHVNASTRQKVQEAIEALGYRPNRIARSLKTNSTRAIGLLVSDIENPFFTSVARGAEDAALDRGYHVILCNTDEDTAREADYLNELAARRVDGLVVASAAAGIGDAKPLTSAGIPTVLIDRGIPGVALPIVKIDNYDGMRLAVTHLSELGHTRIGLIGGQPGAATAEEREAGFRAAVSEHGVALEEALIVHGGFRIEGGRHALTKLWSLTEPPTAVVIANNLMAIGALLAVRDAGVTVPDALSVVTFDDMPWTPLLDPPLTVVAQPARAIGASAVSILVDQIEGGPSPDPLETLFPAQLIVRGSTGPPRSDGDPTKRHVRNPRTLEAT